MTVNLNLQSINLLHCINLLALKFLTLLIAVTVTKAGFSQTLIPLKFESLTINDGLSQGFVSSIIQDKKGFMWFGTSDGLNKYDGYKFTVYHHEPFDSTSVAEDDITCLFEDSQERLWVGTRHNGIDFFDRENLLFSHFTHTGENSIRSNSILNIAEDKTGAFWIRTDRGIDRLMISDKKSFDKNENQKNNFLFNHNFQFTHIKLDEESANSQEIIPVKVFVDSRNYVFVITHKDILEINFNNEKNSYTVTKKYSLSEEDIIPTLIEDSIRHVFFLRTGNAVVKFSNYNFNTPQKIYQPDQFKSEGIIDNRQMLWFGDKNKICRINAQTGKVENIISADPVLAPFVNHTNSFCSDRNGIIWIGTSGFGILKFNPVKELFHHILPDIVAYRLFQDINGDIICNGIYAIMISNKQLVSVDTLTKNFFGKIKSSYAFIWQDEKGDYWLPYNNSIICYNAKTKKAEYFNLPAETGASPFPFFFDSHHNIWTDYNKNLIQFSPTTKSFHVYEYPVQPEAGDYDFLQCFSEDKNGRLWMGSVRGLLCFDIKNNSWKYFEYKQGDTTSLSTNFILSLCDDALQPEKYLWVGTKGGGLNRFDKTTGKFTCYNDKDGLPNNVVYGILTDNDGNLWMSTNRGLSRFNPPTQTFQNFDVSDGLQSNEFDRFSYCKTREGLLFFGGIKGLNYFDPAEIKPLDPPNVLITDFRLFNKTVSFKTPNSPLKKDITYTKEITLNYDQNVITFQFAAMDYRKAGSVRYRYMMKGFDKDWVYSGTNREATYTNLNPGAYTFVVQGSNTEGVWSKQSTELNITIIPPWWKTSWFLVLITIFVTAIVYGIYRYRVYQLLKFERMRNRIASDLHDEIGSSLSTISIYSKVAQEQLNKQTSNPQPLLKKISENTNEMMEAMSDIVWSINARNDRFENIINRMREHAVQLFEAKHYNLHFEFDEKLNHLKFGMEKRKNFYLIYKEALNNIAKYACGKNIWISLVENNSYITLKIKDDGRGFDTTNIRKSSNGLINMKNRATALNGSIQIRSEEGKGTEIKLEFKD